MEFALGRSDHHQGRVKEKKRSESGGGGGDDEGHRKEEIDIEVPPMVDPTGQIVSSTKKEEAEGELESAKTEMGEVREENQRLKRCLDRVLKDYRTLQMQFQDIVQKETKDQPTSDHKTSSDHGGEEEPELVSLSLGRVNNIPRNPENKSKVFKPVLLKHDEELCEEDLALGLDFKFETSKSGGSINIEANNNNNGTTINIIPSPTNSSEVPKEEEGWPPGKVLRKTTRGNGEDEVSQQNPAKKARVCVRARCDAPTMNDGCQWRKYGQKISKGNPCPRAYYRCTIAPSCPVKKQVQRCAEDLSILFTTYEGIHNHPLPLSATAMASTTSAAASMLLSGPSTSCPSSATAATAASTTTTSADLHGLNFYLSDGSKSKQFYLSNPSLSPLPSHPTITLDLTSNSASSRFVTSSSNYNPPRSSYPSSTSLNFNSSSNDFLNYSNNRNVFSSMNLGRTSTMDHNTYRLQPYVQKNSVINNPAHPSQPALPDSVAAATKAIAADPKFQSALAVALSSIIGTGSGIGSNQGNRGGGGGENLQQKMKWGELFPPL